MPEQIRNGPLDYNSASKRHWLYGFNAVVLVIVGLVALIILLYICDRPIVRNYTRWDWTSNRLNSLSDGSKKTLKELDATGQEYVLISMFAPPSDEDRKNNTAVEQEQKRQQVNDLLRDYARNSSRIKVEDKGDAARDEVELMIRERFEGELGPYKTVVEDFAKLATEIGNLLKDEGPAVTAASQKPEATPEQLRFGIGLGAMFSSIPEDLEVLKRMIDRETDKVLPRWNQLKTEVTSALEESGVAPLFETLSDKAQVAKLPPALVAYFEGPAKQRYADMAAKIKAYKDRLAKLEPLKVEEALNGISKNSIIVLGPKAAKVVSNWDIFTEEPSGQPNEQGRPEQTFTGEQAISSALYAMAKPDKVKVVFISGTPQRLMTGLFSRFTASLEKANFQVMEWAPHEHQPGQPPDPQDEPPAQGKGVVWIVMPPEMPNQQMMMMGMQPPNPQALIAATSRHMGAGGSVMFLAEPAAPMMMGPGGFVFDALVKDFGIEVQSKFTVIHLQEREGPNDEVVKQPDPYIQIERFEDHEITRQLQALPTIFGPLQGQDGGASGYTTVVKVSSTVPTGVNARALVKTPYSGDYWGESDPRAELKFDSGVDEKAPVSIVVASIKDAGKETEQRVMVVGNKLFAATPFLQASEVVAYGGQLRRVARFPGNEELARNSVLWLAGYENMISVSAKADAASRIGDMKPGTLLFVQLAVGLLIPAATLVLGATVWMIRRR